MRKVGSILMYGTEWCADCARARHFFKEHNIPYEEHDIEKGEGMMDRMLKLNGGKNITPTIKITYEDGSTRLLMEPSNAELAEALGVQSS